MDTVVGMIKLDQFGRNTQTIESLMRWAKHFFHQSRVMNGTLFLQTTKEDYDLSLNSLNEASDIDFEYKTFAKSTTIAEIEEIIAKAKQN